MDDTRPSVSSSNWKVISTRLISEIWLIPGQRSVPVIDKWSAPDRCCVPQMVDTRPVLFTNEYYIYWSIPIAMFCWQNVTDGVKYHSDCQSVYTNRSCISADQRFCQEIYFIPWSLQSLNVLFSNCALFKPSGFVLFSVLADINCRTLSLTQTRIHIDAHTRRHYCLCDVLDFYNFCTWLQIRTMKLKKCLNKQPNPNV